jgi:hypothetical protein
MTYRALPCSTPAEVEALLNGAHIMGAFYATDRLPIGGLTLNFTTPARTVTFGSSGDTMSPKQIADAIKAAHVDFADFDIRVIQLAAQAQRVGILIQNDAGFVIANTGTANSLLRIPAAGVTSEGILGPTEFQVVASSISGQYLVIIGSAA